MHARNWLRGSALLASFLLATTVAGDDERTSWSALSPGLWHRMVRLESADESAALEAHAFRVDPKLVELLVVDSRTSGRGGATAVETRNELGALLVANGGFFDRAGRPLGLVIGKKGTTSPLRRLDQGIFLLSGGVPQIIHASEPLPPRLDAALQSWPRLVANGRALKLKPQASRRTCLCVPGDGTVLIAVFPGPVLLQTVADWMASSPTLGGLGCWAALNLDGGPSTQLSLRTGILELDIPGGWPVPTSIAVVPRRPEA